MIIPSAHTDASNPIMQVEITARSLKIISKFVLPFATSLDTTSLNKNLSVETNIIIIGFDFTDMPPGAGAS